MSWIKKAAAGIGTAIGKTVLYAVATAVAFVASVGATPHRNDAVEVTHMAAAQDRTGTYGHVYVPGDTGRVTGSLEFRPWEVYPCWYGCSGELTFSDPQPPPGEPDIPQASLPLQTFPLDIFDDDTQTYDPGEDIDPADLPVAALDGPMWFDQSIIDIVSLDDAERLEVDYRASVPQTRLIMDRPQFLVIAEPELGFPPIVFGAFASALPSNAIPSNILAQEKFLFFVPLENGAIPSNEVPPAAIPSNLRISEAIPSNAIPSNYHRAIPSNAWGLIYAIPSNMTRADLLALGADANKLPAEIPLNLTVGDLRRYGIPNHAIPSNAIPSNAIPSNAIPSNLVLSDAIPSNLVVLDLLQSLIDIPQLGIEVGLRPQPILQSQMEFDLGIERAPWADRVKVMGCDESCSSSGRIVVDAEAADADYDLASIVSELSENPLLEVFRSGNDRVQIICGDSCETVAIPYRTGREQLPDVGVETVFIGPNAGVEMVSFGATAVCTEDLSTAERWVGHLASGSFALRFIVGSGESYQNNAYLLSIDNQLEVECSFDVENPRVLHCIRDEITPERWVGFNLRAQPSGCEVYSDSLYVCPYGETYHAPNPWWTGAYGLCCTTSCWCTLPGGETGCFNNCPGCPP